MQNSHPVYTAHIRKWDNTKQTVFQHNDNVAQLAAETGAAYGLKHLACIAGRHHDAGKNTVEFNDYIHAAAEGKKVVRGSVVHAVQGAMLVNTLVADNKEEVLLTDELIRNAILSHHGLRDCISLAGTLVYQAAQERVLPSFDDIKPLIEAHYGLDALKQEFAAAVEEIAAIRKQMLAYQQQYTAKRGNIRFLLALYVRLLTAILIDADRTDTACFMDNLPLPTPPSQDQIINQWSAFTQHFEQKLQAYIKNKPPSSLDNHRIEISEACKHFDGGDAGVFRLVVPCGAGKTLASLRYALHTAKRYGKKHIFYISPYRSILEQNAAEIRAYVGCDDAVLEHHSNILFEGEDAAEKEKAYGLLTENWSQSPIIATTAVQLLNTLFSSKTSSLRRMQALGNSVLIIDEIQALPLKVLKLFNGAMNFLAAFCKTNVVLCSATQPPLHLLDTYQILHPVSMIAHTHTYHEAFRRVQLIDNTKNPGYTFDETANFLFTKSRDVASLLLVVNTKKCAREVFRLLDERIKADGESNQYALFHLSTNMCPAHRAHVLAQLRASLGDKQFSKKIICISTSLIEAGVDVSFACVVRALAGLDSIVQTAGRCNRHREVDTGFVYVLNMSEENMKFFGHLQKAQEATSTLLHHLKTCPQHYPDGAFSETSMGHYYNLYYKLLLEEMAYPLPNDPEHSIIDLLTTNTPGTKRVKAPSNVKLPLLKQAFKEAGDAFAVIDDGAKLDVVVVYDQEAKHQLNKLHGAGSNGEKRLILKRLQPYVVQVQKYRLQDLSPYLQAHDSGIFTLDYAYYDPGFGVDESGNMPMQFLAL